MTDPILRLKSALSDRYAIEREVGAGGMATVYLARDLRHDRKVALKVLRPELAALVGAERFLTEIRTTASLQHPHILPLFDSGQADGFLFYVMPYVEGESLRERLKRDKQLPVAEAVRIATAVAQALHYAHRHGVIHRDVKPENVLLHDGQPLVADFGIALAVSAAGSARLTETGLSLGTPCYMSPEQATADRDPGPASDVYSLACVLYEMLAGEPPHSGSTAQAVLAKILTAEPRPVRETRRAVPANVEAAIAKALERLPADRFESAEGFGRALSDPGFRHRDGLAGERRGARDPFQTGAFTQVPFLAVSALAALSLGAAAWGWLRAPEPPVPPAATRTEVQLSIPTAGGGTRVAISPDGRWIAYSGGSESVTSLYVRRSDQDSIRLLPGTEGAANSDFSPDGQRIVFSVGARLKMVSVEGGPVLTLAPSLTGPDWGEDGFIYGRVGTSLARIPETGGPPDILLEAGPDELFRSAHLLPDGGGLLFTRFRSIDDSDIELLNLETGEARLLIEQASDPHYLATGHVIYGHYASQTLMAVPFSLENQEVRGNPVPVLAGVTIGSNDGAVMFAVSDQGTAVYQHGSRNHVRPTLVDPAGGAQPLPVTLIAESGGSVRFSPDARSLAFEDRWHIQLYDLQLGTKRALTSRGANMFPFWSPDGQTVTLSANVTDGNGTDVYRFPVEGSGPPTRLFTTLGAQWASAWSRDGRVLLITELHPERRDYDLRLVTSGDSTWSPYLVGEWNETASSLSPDGRFAAYISDETGRYEVYLREFPRPGEQLQVSVEGGTEPVWAPDGSRLYYRADDALWAATVVTEPSMRVLGREVVIPDVSSFAANLITAAYDVRPDGRGFVFLASEAAATGGDGRLSIVVNWFEELRQRMAEAGGVTR